MSRIYYQGKFYDYPIKPFNALRNLGLVEADALRVSYLWVRVRPPKDQTMLEGYIAADYGWRLYHHFFKTYNEKLWGVPASSISADWAAQRIKGMSLWTPCGSRSRVKLLGQRRQGRAGHQPDRGVPVPEVRPRDDVGALPRPSSQEQGTKVEMKTRVVGVNHEDGRAVVGRGRARGRRPARCRPTTSSPRCRSRSCSGP